MEHIRQAIERAKIDRRKSAVGERSATTGAEGDRSGREPAKRFVDRRSDKIAASPIDGGLHFRTNRRLLQEHRIIAQEGADPRAIHYDMLRTQVLQVMGENSLKSVAITSPKVGCGKTITSINLALSLARQSESSILLVDLDLRRPMVARNFGIEPTNGIADVAAGRCQLTDALLIPDLCDQRLALLPTPKPVANPTELLVSSNMKSFIAELKDDARFQIVMFDLPPMLSSDDFLAFMPQVDCTLLIAAVGQSTVHEISECERLMPEGAFLGCVLNKASAAEASYGSYS